MPASSGDPVSAALRLSLATDREDRSNLDIRLAASCTRVFTTHIAYEQAPSYQSKVLNNLKSKYILLKPSHDNTIAEVKSEPTDNMKPDSTLPTPKETLFPAERVQLGWRGIHSVGAGFINVGNSCYLNASLQALFHVPALVNWLHSDSVHLNKCVITNGIVHGECIICAMSKTLKASQSKTCSVIKPSLICNKLKLICKHMVHGQQEDAHEFMRYLIESMEKSYLNRFKGNKFDNYNKETTPLNQIFGGYMRTEVKCMVCHSVSTTFQHFQDLLLDIRRAVSVQDALNIYFANEQLDEADYKCDKCNKKVNAMKRFYIEKPPRVLCVQLKRFSIMGGKMNKHVSVPHRLELLQFLCQQSAYNGGLSYRLVAMVNHVGSSVNCGHYTALARTSSGQLYHFDDSTVRPVSSSIIPDANAYIIVYELEHCQKKTASPAPVVPVHSPKKVHPIVLPFNNTKKNQPMVLHSPKKLLPSLPLSLPHHSPKKTNALVPYEEDSDDSVGKVSQGWKVKDASGAGWSVTELEDGEIIEPESTEVKLKRKRDIQDEGRDCSWNIKHSKISPFSDKVMPDLTKINGHNKDSSDYNGILNGYNKVASERSSKVNGQSTLPFDSNGNTNGQSKGTPEMNGKINGQKVTSGSMEKVNGQNVSPYFNGVINGNNRVAPDLNGKGNGQSKAPDFNGKVNGQGKTPDFNGKVNGHNVVSFSWNGKANGQKKIDKHKSADWNGQSKVSYEWNGQNKVNSVDGSTAQYLKKLSHRGYGNSTVQSWEGGRSHVDRDAAHAWRVQRKRDSSRQYDDDLDRGHKKKIRKHTDNHKSSYNKFQHHQDQRGPSWSGKIHYNKSHGHRHKHRNNNNHRDNWRR